MTIAISLKVNDGVVLASDSASTLSAQDENGNVSVVNVYNNADKVFNLYKGAPIGAITWGSGGIGNSSIATLLKDFRQTLHDDESVTENSINIESIAKRLNEFIFDEKYNEAFGDWPTKPVLGFIVAGYSMSTDRTNAEEYMLSTDEDGHVEGPIRLRQDDESGLTWQGQPEAICRLILGRSMQLPFVLSQHLGIPDDQVELVNGALKQYLGAPFVQPPMPIQDAIDLAEFLVDVTIKFSKFSPGATMVDGPIDIASITKHEGFKWIRRKHYYPRDINPGG